MADLSKEEKRILITLGILLLIGMLFYFVRQIPGSQNTVTETIIDTVTQNSTALPPSEIFVHISGAVKNPGVYKLTFSARTWEALTAAGGPLPNADLDKVNLTKKVEDAEKIVISFKEHTRPKVTKTSVSNNKIDLNNASISELCTLPKVGPVTAKRIIEYRSKKSFKSIEDIQNVKGIGKKTFAKLKDRLEV